jgi:hypothetical protein
MIGLSGFILEAMIAARHLVRRYTIVNILWKRTQRDFSGNLLKTASINGSVNSAPSACPKYLQHSMNFISAASPPSFRSGSSSFIDSPNPR